MRDKRIKKEYIKKNSNKNFMTKRRKLGLIRFIVICSLILILVIIFSTNSIVKYIKYKQINSSVTNNVRDKQFNIGIVNIDTYNMLTTKNSHVNQVANIYTNKLIAINNNYEIKMELAKSITKKSNIEYHVALNENIKWNNYRAIGAEDLIYTINYIKSLNNNNSYYNMVSNISYIEAIDYSNVKILLTNPDELFAYKLEIPLIEKDKGQNNNYSENIQSINDFKIDEFTNNNIKLVNNNLKDKIDSKFNIISIKNYVDVYSIIKAFKNSEIDSFLTERTDIIGLLGRNPYNIKMYKNGEGIYILGNPNSSMYSKKEVRQAIAYSIDRNNIIKNIDNLMAETIDLPFLNSEIKYKYSKESARKVLSDNGWQFSNNYWNKNVNGNNQRLAINLLVNNLDVRKMQISNYIKQDLESIGIIVNINALTPEQVMQRINIGNYDIVLSTLNIDNIPNINSIDRHLIKNDNLNQAINNVNISNIDDYSKNIKNLQSALSEDVNIIGIYAEQSALIYSKNIIGNVNPNLIDVFDNFNTWDRQ